MTPTQSGARKPFEFQRHGEPLTLEDVVYQAVGAASVCWEHLDQSGPFMPDRAREIAEALLAFIREHVTQLVANGQPAFTGTLEDLWRDLTVARTPIVPLPARVALYELP